MLFNSIHFLIFFPVVILLYFAISHKYRWAFLLLVSYYFYMSWKPEYIVLIIVSTLVDYFSAIEIYKTNNKKKKKFFLYLSLFVNLGILFSFKYWNFFNESLVEILKLFTINLQPTTVAWLLPVGISFYTFQTISYTIDVYRGKIEPEKHLGIFAVYVSFFPQLVAGPIERAKNLLPQFYEKHYFDYVRVTDGLKLMMWGFFKKVVIADRLAIYVNQVYGNVESYTGLPLIVATVFFAFQIYCDFSGYSDIAIGVAQVMGFNLMDNFRRPYFSRSISEFWGRWHISLSTWFKDYVYIPLGGNRVSVPRWYLNLFLVFLISGLWHGASWTFVIWGGLHGFYLIFGILFKKYRIFFMELIKIGKYPKILLIVEIIFTFILVNIGWVFFRANNINDAFYILAHMFSDIKLYGSGITNGVGREFIVLSISLIIFMEAIHFAQEHIRIRQFLSDRPFWIRWSVYLSVLFLILLFGVFNNSEFIYFQF